MKSIFTKTAALLFAFLIGLAAFQYSDVLPENEFRAENLEVIEPNAEKVSVCRIMDEPTLFDGKLVSFQATAYVTYDVNWDAMTILNAKDCYYSSYPTFVQMNLDAYNGAYSNLKSLLEGEDRKWADDYKEVDVQVIGTTQKIYDADGYGYYSFSPADIKIISSFRKFESRGGA